MTGPAEAGTLARSEARHGHVGGGEVDRPGLEVGDAGAAAHARVVDLQARVLAGVGEEGLGEERLDEGRAGGV